MRRIVPLSFTTMLSSSQAFTKLIRHVMDSRSLSGAKPIDYS
jgi:hypothetical protein